MKNVSSATLNEMKVSALHMQEKLNSADAGEVQNAMKEYEALVDLFYQRNEYLMAPKQYKAAKQDFEYFMRLLELAIHHL